MISLIMVFFVRPIIVILNDPIYYHYQFGAFSVTISTCQISTLVWPYFKCSTSK